MTLPISANTTCDVYRSGHAPPAAPDVAGVKGHLCEHFHNIKPPGSQTSPFGSYTHILYVDVNADIRGGEAAMNPDTVYVPDKNGTLFNVVWVARQGRGTSLDMRVVYLSRGAASWPTAEL